MLPGNFLAIYILKHSQLFRDFTVLRVFKLFTLSTNLEMSRQYCLKYGWGDSYMPLRRMTLS